MSVSNLRKAWREFKQQFDTHLGPTLGDKWTRKAFGLGLGPKLDAFDRAHEQLIAAWMKATDFMAAAEKGDLSAINEVQAKMGSVQRHHVTVDKLAGEVLAKLNSYQDILQQGMAEAQRRGALPHPAQDAFRKAFGSLNVMRDGVNAVRADGAKYAMNARTWQAQYVAKLKRR